jgi:hypothetical protein
VTPTARGVPRRAAPEGIVIRAVDADVRALTLLPLLAYGPEPEAAAAADAVVLQAADEESLHSLAERCEKLGLEVVVACETTTSSDLRWSTLIPRSCF